MDFAHDAEDLAVGRSGVVNGGEDPAGDGEDFPADADGFPEADDFPGDPDDFPGAVPGQLAEPRPATGEPRVDAALARLDELAGRPVTEHRAVFEDVHRRLRDVLGELDSRQQPPSRDATDAAGRPGR
jgi:hypothetical protein